VSGARVHKHPAAAVLHQHRRLISHGAGVSLHLDPPALAVPATLGLTRGDSFLPW